MEGLHFHLDRRGHSWPIFSEGHNQAFWVLSSLSLMDQVWFFSIGIPVYGNRYCKFSPAWTLDAFIVHIIVLLLLVDTVAL